MGLNINNMEQISLEEKVNNTLKWLANQIACTQVYKKWDEEFKKESLNDAWQKVQEQFKKDIDWNALTESQCKALHFGSWQSEEDIEEEISCLQSALDKGHLTKEEFDKKIANEKNTLGLRLVPLYLYPSLPIGITLTSIGGEERVFDGSNISTDSYIYMGRGTQIPVAVTFLKEALRSSSEKNCLGKMSLSNLKENK